METPNISRVYPNVTGGAGPLMSAKQIRLPHFAPSRRCDYPKLSHSADRCASCRCQLQVGWSGGRPRRHGQRRDTPTPLTAPNDGEKGDVLGTETAWRLPG